MQVLSPDALLHITGYGDFQVESLQADDEEYIADPMSRQSLEGLVELGQYGVADHIVMVIWDHRSDGERAVIDHGGRAC